MTLISSVNRDNQGTYQFQQVWILKNPPVGTLTVTGSAPGSCGAGAMVFTNIDQLNTIKEDKSSGGTANGTFAAADPLGAAVCIGSVSLPAGFTFIMQESNFVQGGYKMQPTATQAVVYDANNGVSSICFRYIVPPSGGNPVALSPSIMMMKKFWNKVLFKHGIWQPNTSLVI